jgi:hypothetical protein
VRYRRWRLIVELDGLRGHPTRLAHRDRLRDNDRTLAGERTLRYGWFEVVELNCEAARQVSDGLRRGGWTGRPRRCGHGCRLEA